MDNELGKRILTPILMVLGLLVGVALIAFSISRVLLAVPEVVATFTALLLAAYVLALAVIVGKRRTISARALGGGLAIGLVALLGAGIVSAQAGIRDLHGEEHGGEGEGAGEGEGDGSQDEVAEIPDDALLFVAIDVDFAEEATSASAGEHVIAIDNQGNLPHNVVFPDLSFRVDADGGGQDAATITLEPGSYDYICDIPGHAGTMNGTLEVN